MYAQGYLYVQRLDLHTQGLIDIQFSCISTGCVCTRLVVWTTAVYAQGYLYLQRLDLHTQGLSKGCVCTWLVV